MDSRSDLIEIIAQLDAMLPRFKKSQSGLYMGDGDEPVFTQLVIEAKVILDEEFGRANDFSMNLVRAANVGVSNFVGSPSYHSVQQVAAFLRAGVSQIDRRARRANPSASVPASDRYVALNDNERGGVGALLLELKDETRAANDVEEEDRLVALSEIASFEATIIQPRVSTDLIQRFIDSVLAWIQRTFSRAAVQEVAQRLIVALMKIVMG